LKELLKEKSNKVIIFSQWDILLEKLDNILKEYGLISTNCKGTVYQKKKAIKEFTSKHDKNIIMLSSNNAASGINLTIANKIILLEPVYGSKQYRSNIENQAIGRSDRIGQNKPIDVFRFIIKDTIEEDILNNNIKEDEIPHITF
jgi:DNA repair protein RAD5